MTNTFSWWNRLEPVPRSNDLTQSLRAELGDPAWLMARQWQFGELAGEDAGSPVESVATVEVAEISRFGSGTVISSATDNVSEINAQDVPLETLVERRPMTGQPADLRIRIDAGQQFLRFLTAHGARTQRQPYIDHYPIDLADAPERSTSRPSTMFDVAAAVPDGRTIAEALLKRRGKKPQLTTLPARPELAASLASKVLAAANSYLDWWERFQTEPEPEDDCWNSRRLEYGFMVQATMSDGDVVLRADDYTGGHLDWFEFEADSRQGMDSGTKPPEPRTIVRRTMPTRAFYGGMPAERFWEFEDSSVRFGVGSVGRTDIAHLLLDEFALSYGNDWYVVPLRLPVGAVCSVRELKVVDSFGLETVVRHTSKVGAANWGAFNITPHPRAAQRVDHLFFLPPALGGSQEGDPIEEVSWFRDEMANLVWGVERLTEGALGGSVDQYEQARKLAPILSQQVTGEIGDAELIYRLNSSVPENWFPLVPVRRQGTAAASVGLQLRPLTRVDPDGESRVTEPTARVLTSAQPLIVSEEEIGRSGKVTGTHWQLNRNSRGEYFTWLSHRVKSGRGEGSSGLVFDTSRPVEK